MDPSRQPPPELGPNASDPTPPALACFCELRRSIVRNLRRLLPLFSAMERIPPGLGLAGETVERIRAAAETIPTIGHGRYDLIVQRALAATDPETLDAGLALAGLIALHDTHVDLIRSILTDWEELHARAADPRRGGTDAAAGESAKSPPRFRCTLCGAWCSGANLARDREGQLQPACIVCPELSPPLVSLGQGDFKTEISEADLGKAAVDGGPIAVECRPEDLGVPLADPRPVCDLCGAVAIEPVIEDGTYCSEECFTAAHVEAFRRQPAAAAKGGAA